MLVAGNVHLFYCLNIYPVSTKAELEEAVLRRAKRVVDASGLCERAAVGIWLKNSLVSDFDPHTFKRKLDDSGLYCVSFNGFPYGAFHGSSIKQKVYLPDWANPLRMEYTKNLALKLSQLLSKGEVGTISTLPLGYRNTTTRTSLEYAIANLRGCGRFLSELYKESGRKIMLALEPEPDCWLDESAGAAQWLDEVLFDCSCGEMLREFIGVCLDTVHSAVLFETPLESLRSFQARGVKVAKVQLGSAISADSAPGRAELKKYSDEVYLHQTRVRAGGEVHCYKDLPQALAENRQGQWRVHYHVPLTWEGGGGLSSTAEDVDGAFFKAALACGVRQFEVEIYTLDLLPGKKLSADEMLINDLRHVHAMLLGAAELQAV